MCYVCNSLAELDDQLIHEVSVPFLLDKRILQCNQTLQNGTHFLAGQIENPFLWEHYTSLLSYNAIILEC